MKKIDQLTRLRKKAEEALKSYDAQKDKNKFVKFEEALHELQVYQIELELQNEELMTAQLELTRQRKKYEDLYDFAPVGYISIDEEGAILEINRAATELFAVRKERAIGTNITDYVAPDYQDAVYFFLRRINKSEERESAEMRIRSLENRFIYVQIEAQAMREKNGDIENIYLAVSNVDKLRKTQDRLRDNVNKIRIMSELTSDYIYSARVNIDGSIEAEWRSGSFEKLTGYDNVENIDFAEWETKIHEEDRQRVISSLSYVLGNNSISNEYRIITKYGETKWLRDNIKPVWDESENRVVRILGAVQDITARKRAEIEIENKQRFINSIVNTTPAFIFIHDLNSNSIVYANEAAKTVVGFSPEELRKMGDYVMHKLIHPEDISDVQARLAELLETSANATLDMQYRMRNKEGNWVWIYNKGMVFRRDRNGAPTQIIGSIIDFTEIVETKNQLLELNATKDKLFSIIAHDLLNPLGGIKGATEAIIEEFDELSRDDKIEILQSLKQSSINVFALLENLLQWSRSQFGKVNVYMKTFDLKPIIDSNIRLFQINAKTKKLKVKSMVDDSRFVYADPDMINTVVRNLLSNAVKFTNHGGNIVISEKTEDEVLYLTIEDDGVGMDDETLKKLFNEFQPNHSKGTDNEVGSGLGLVICKDFVKLNKTVEGSGQIFVNSAPGEGSAFSISLQAVK